MVEPNIVVNTGASATIGTAAAALTSGVASSDTIRDRAASSASPTPEHEADDQPDQGVPAGHGRGREDRREGATTCAAIALGAGSRKAGTPVTVTTSSHSSSAATPEHHGRPDPAERVAAARPRDGGRDGREGHALPLRSASRTSVTAAKNSADSRTSSTTSSGSAEPGTDGGVGQGAVDAATGRPGRRPAGAARRSRR